jgi:hypothetical protein
MMLNFFKNPLGNAQLALIVISSLGLMTFLVVSFSTDFNNRINANLYTKKPSFASEENRNIGSSAPLPLDFLSH